MAESTDETTEKARRLLKDLVQALERDGSLRSPQWRAAMERVPRHIFLPSFYRDAPGPDGVTRYTSVSRDINPGEWLALTYENKTWVTQIDYGATTTDGVAVSGTPTSSSTLPGVVVRMLEDLDAPDGARVLEVGTGTGYSTALLCARLGDEYVTSVEHDAGLSRVAGERLASLGYRPRLVVGDGALGYPDSAPYGRIIATYSPSHVPAAWLAQATPDAIILASVVGGLGAYGYVRLDMCSDSEARGRFINGDVSFMLSRETTLPMIGPLMRAAHHDRQGAAGSATPIDAAVLSDPGLLWAAQLALPGTVQLGLNADGLSGQWFLHPDGSWAALETAQDGATQAYQGGPRSLCARLGEVAAKWLADDRPGLDRYGMTVTPELNTVWLDEPGNRVGSLPA